MGKPLVKNEGKRVYKCIPLQVAMVGKWLIYAENWHRGQGSTNVYKCIPLLKNKENRTVFAVVGEG